VCVRIQHIKHALSVRKSQDCGNIQKPACTVYPVWSQPVILRIELGRVKGRRRRKKCQNMNNIYWLIYWFNTCIIFLFIYAKFLVQDWLEDFTEPFTMTLMEFFGCTFIAFSTPFAMFVYTIARDPLRVIVLIAR
jgi:hypothetical protein